MTHKLTITIIILSLILISTPAYSLDPYTISIQSDNDAVLAGQKITTTAKITNNLNHSDTVEIYILGGPKTYWITLNDYSIKLKSDETKSFKFYISPPLNTPVNKYLFRMKAISKNNTEHLVTKDINIYVIEVSKIDLTTFATDKDYYNIGDKVTLTTAVKNIGTGKSKNATIKIQLTGTTTDEKTINIPPLEVEEEHIETIEYTFDPFHDKDTFELSGTLFDNDDTEVSNKKNTFEIEKKVNIDKRRTESSTILEKTINIQATNQGNDRGTIQITESKSDLPQIIEFDTLPEERITNGQTIYVWTCDLEPQQACTITYTIKYWIYFIAATILIAILFVMTNIAEKPHITKKYKKGTIHTVNLEIKNNSRRPLEDVQVQDMIPQIFSVIENNSTIRPALTKRKKNGTLLVWKLGKLAPKDERIISYKIKPILDVEGKIRLPPAKIIGKDPNGVNRKNISQHISID